MVTKDLVGIVHHVVSWGLLLEANDDDDVDLVCEA